MEFGSYSSPRDISQIDAELVLPPGSQNPKALEGDHLWELEMLLVWLWCLQGLKGEGPTHTEEETRSLASGHVPSQDFFHKKVEGQLISCQFLKDFPFSSR